MKYSQEQALALLHSKSNWILSTAAKLAEEAAAVAKLSAVADGTALYRGDQYTLAVAYHPVRPSVRLDGNLLRVCLPEVRRHDANAVPNALIGWYINQAKRDLTDKTRDWSSIIGVHPVAVTIRDPKTRWGSCSSVGRINYSWRVVLAPPAVIDYLVVHELCHLIEPNHSIRYWTLVESFLPDYHLSRRWLKTNGNVLMSLFSVPFRQ